MSEAKVYGKIPLQDSPDKSLKISGKDQHYISNCKAQYYRIYTETTKDSKFEKKCIPSIT